MNTLWTLTGTSLLIAALLSGCSTNIEEETQQEVPKIVSETSTNTTASTLSEVVTGLSTADFFSSRDYRTEM